MAEFNGMNVQGDQGQIAPGLRNQSQGVNTHHLGGQ